jgi:hypothetical protein
MVGVFFVECHIESGKSISHSYERAADDVFVFAERLEELDKVLIGELRK